MKAKSRYDKDGRIIVSGPTFSPGEWIWIIAAWMLFVVIPLLL